MTTETEQSERVLHLSDEAVRTVLELRATEPNPDQLALWVDVSGANGGDFTYDMYFESVADAGAGAAIERFGDLAVVVPETSVDKVRGAVLALATDGSGGMVMQNPNRPQASAASPAMGGPAADLSGDVAQRVLQVLEQQINPSIAAHGGRADLVAVEEGTAFLRLGGGCAGCGLAAVTLSQGIEVAIRDSVPEITRVVDVTDHAAGTNPFYEPSKK